jgi:3-hydroxyisobutyrate dehydrogenase
MLTSLAAILSLLLLAPVPPQASAPASDDVAVRVPLDNYLKGHATGDASYMRKAFLPTAHIEGVREGKFLSWTVDEYCGRFTGKPAEDEATRKRKIDRVDVTGSAAMARLTLVHGQTTLTDYFVLLKIDGEWKIANKVWTANPPR